MFTAFSTNLSKPINIDDVTDLNDTFVCLNKKCSAEFHIKSLNGEKKNHFCRYHRTQHVAGCPYDFNHNNYIDDEMLIKSSVMDIYNHARKPVLSSKNSSSKVTVNQGNIRNKSYINTTKQLLRYCLVNQIDKLYDDKTAVGDIILDNRNLLTNENYKGISGLRLVVGETVRYIQNDFSFQIKVSTVTQTGREVYLTANVYMPMVQYKKIRDYLMDTFGNIKGHQIAVLGIWKTEKRYNISCNVTEQTNIVYKFANETKKK